MQMQRQEAKDLESYKTQAQDILERREQGNNFVMIDDGKTYPHKVEIPLNQQIKDNIQLDTDVLKADLQKLKNTHPELFETKGSVARLIKKIQENPTFFFKNNRLDMKLVGSYINDNFAEIGVIPKGKNTGDIGHILKTSNSEKRINKLTDREEALPLAETANLGTLSNRTDGRNGANTLLEAEYATIKNETNQEILKNISQKPQTTQEIIKEAKEKGLSVKETKELIQKNQNTESNLKEANIKQTESNLNHIQEKEAQINPQADSNIAINKETQSTQQADANSINPQSTEAKLNNNIDSKVPTQEATKQSESNFTYTTQETKGIRDLRNELKEALSPYLNKEIVNKETGLKGVITTEEVKKIMSKKAIDKSVANGFSRDEHIKVAQDLEKLFTESKLLKSHKDYK